MPNTYHLLEDFKPNQIVCYTSKCGRVEFGRVSSVNDTFVFVKFDDQVRMHGMEGCTAQGCDPLDLVIL